MCIYTYHHYPLCGHISNWTVTSCLEFTSQLRLLSGTGDILCCDDVRVTHDLHPTAPHSLCTQCDFEWAEAMTSKDPDALQRRTYRTIEGLDAKFPVIEFAVRMTVDVRKEVTESSLSNSTDDDQSNAFAAPVREYTPCRSSCPCRKTHYPSVDRATQGMSSGMDSTSDTVSDFAKQVGLEGGVASQPDTGEAFNTRNEELPTPEALTADILRALPESNTTEDGMDSPSVYSYNSSACSSDDKAGTRSTDRLERPERKDTSSGKLKVWDAALSDASSLHLVGRARYGWLTDLDYASVEISQHLDEVEGRVRVHFDTEDTDSPSEKSSVTDPSDHDISAAREYRVSVDRPGTPYSGIGPQCTTPRRFVAAASEEEPRELGLRCPLRIGNLYAGY